MTALFLSFGTSLADWNRQGILEAEIAMHRVNGALWIVAPDREAPRLHWTVTPLLRPWWMPGLLYGFLSPVVHRRVLRERAEFLGHNGRALWAPSIARMIFGGRMTIRFGYIWSWDAVQRGVSGIRLWAILCSEWIACRCADAVLVAAPWQATYLREVHGIE